MLSFLSCYYSEQLFNMMRGLAGGKAVASPLPSTKVLGDRISPFKGPLATPFTAHRPNSRQWTNFLGTHNGCTPLQASLRDSGPLIPREPEIDPDLHAVLNMASDEELEELYSGLYGKEFGQKNFYIVWLPTLLAS